MIRMPDTECKICGNNFYVKPSHKKLGWGKYCSILCRNKSQFNGKNVNCFSCGKEIYRSLAQQTKSASGKFFCSKSCQTLWRNAYFSGKMHSNWLGGISAYRKILKRESGEPICAHCRLRDERILSVHHIDRNRHNNKPSNLVWVCFNCHYLIHHDKSFDKRFMKVMHT